MRVRLTPRAASDLDGIAAYLVARNPRAAERVEGALQDAFGIIAAYPYIGNATRMGVRRFTLPRYPYLIYYGVHEADDVVDVFTVRHASRQDPDPIVGD